MESSMEQEKEEGEQQVMEPQQEDGSASAGVVIEEDDEGLRVDGYDVILCGTGLVQSILASALARAGKRILHCDGNSAYGELHAVVSLRDYQEHLEHLSSTNSDIVLHSHGPTTTTMPLKVGSSVSTPYGSGTILNLPSSGTLSTNSNYNNVSVTLSFGTVYFGMEDTKDGQDWSQMLEERENVVSHDVQHVRSLLSQASLRYFALDLTPGLLYGSGPAVQGLVDSSVSEYCEFKNVLGLYIYQPSASQKQRIRQQAKTPVLARVPCSKGDVFKTKLLSPIDKRRLMKFLQLASDYAVAQVMKQAPINTPSTTDNENSTQTAGTEGQNNNESHDHSTAGATVAKKEENDEMISSVNERHLKQGRSLSRPQNKEVSTTALDLLQTYIEKNEFTLDQYLTKEHALSDNLRHLVLFALALSSSTQVSVKDGMDQLCLHLQSLGRYGKTAFLAPIYGAGELTQAFCRSAAVHGATYLLRRNATEILLSKSDGDSGTDATNKQIKGIALSPPSFTGDDTLNENVEKTILAPHVVISKTALSSKMKSESFDNSKTTSVNNKLNIHYHHKRRVLRRISILSKSLIREDDNPNDEQRHVIIIPPSSGIENPYVIQCVVLDESVSVAPVGATVLHITTTIDTTENGNDIDVDDSILERAVKELIQSDQENDSLQEIFHISYSYPFTVGDCNGKDNDTSNIDDNLESPSHETNETNSNIPDGLHLCDSPSPVMTELDSAFVQAKQLFEKIVDDKSLDFLSLSNKMEEVIRENHAGRLAHDEEEDEESKLLQSAISMLNTTDA